MASWREKLAAEAGMSLKDYIKTPAYKKAKEKRDQEEEAKNSKKNETNSIKDYYHEKEGDINAKADTGTKRIAEDLASIMADAEIKQTRATEDFLRNMQNLADNKAADVEDINYYVKTQSGRTQEDLDTSLAKESRRYSIEFDKTNQNLADNGMTFSDRKQEKVDAQGNAMNVEDVNRVAKRSFADIARYETVQNRDIQIKYGQQEETLKTGKARTMEDILNDNAKAAIAAQRGNEDIATGKAIDIRDNNYAEKGAITDTNNFWDTNANTQKNNQETLKVNG